MTIQEERAALKKRLDEIGMLYDWSKAPEWANWAAMDEDSEMWWYEEKPVITEGYDDCGRWYAEKRGEAANESIKLRSVPWNQSLEQRPGITQ